VIVDAGGDATTITLTPVTQPVHAFATCNYWHWLGDGFRLIIINETMCILGTSFCIVDVVVKAIFFPERLVIVWNCGILSAVNVVGDSAIGSGLSGISVLVDVDGGERVARGL
jgi:hypothetical protein